MSMHDDPSQRRDAQEPDGTSQKIRPDVALRRIGEALHGLRYGSVLAIVQDGVVVQIERTEKTRIGR
jgi:hypothetical protein